MRASTTTQECPRSYVKAESIARVERFFANKHFGVPLGDITARDADAFLALEYEWEAEKSNGQP
jgi:hypothetical protein